MKLLIASYSTVHETPICFAKALCLKLSEQTKTSYLRVAKQFKLLTPTNYKNLSMYTTKLLCHEGIVPFWL